MTKLTEEQLGKAVARIAELDAERTQGLWERNRSYYQIVSETDDSFQEIATCKKIDDARFITTALQRVLIIAQLWEERQNHIAVMREAKEALEGLYDDNLDYSTINNLGAENNHWMRGSRKALASLNTALEGTDETR